MVKYIYCDDVRHFSSFLYKLIPTLLGVKEDVQHIFLRAKDGCHPDHAKIELYLTLLRIEFYRNVKIEGCDQTMRIVPRPAELEAGYMRAYELASRFEDEQGQPMFADAMPRVHVAILDLIRRDEVSDPEDFQMWGVSGGKVKAFRSGSQVESLWSTLSNFFPPVIGPVLAQKMALLRIAKLLIDAHVRWKGKQDVGTYLLTLLFKGREAFLAAGLRMPPEFEVLCLSALDSGERWGVDAATFYEEHGLTEEHILADQDAFENKMYSIVQRLRVNDTEVQDAQDALESAVAIHTGGLECTCSSDLEAADCPRHLFMGGWSGLAEGDRTWSRLKDMLSQVRHICNIVCNNDHNATSPLAKELVQLHQNLKAKAAALNTLPPSAGPSSASPRDSLAAGARVLHFDHSARQQLKDRRVVKARTQKETRSLDVGQRFGAITWKELHLMEKLEEDHSGAAEIIRAWNEKVDAAEGEEVHTLKPTPFSPRHQGDVPQKIRGVQMNHSWLGEEIVIQVMEEDATITVTELQCKEEGCAPYETVITLHLTCVNLITDICLAKLVTQHAALTSLNPELSAENACSEWSTLSVPASCNFIAPLEPTYVDLGWSGRVWKISDKLPAGPPIRRITLHNELVKFATTTRADLCLVGFLPSLPLPASTWKTGHTPLNIG
ncbi:hypothetical protein CYMTET_11516 [Cymbomonas tetramitiformis]|uniref:Uncharacterized protein n=1 Tax=Cymbomonas tetramitiformis TaxID=36881 RepID=A0AAE0GMI0_9CHLO|nr:hypothetical protein CYMTET_11516 [Cymbomonas tetramitiformis]